MKKLGIIIGIFAFATAFTGCTSAYYASAGYAGDDLYALHDRAQIARKQQAKAEAEAKGEKLSNVDIAKIRAQAKVNTQNTQQEDTVDPDALLAELGIKKKLFGYSTAELEKKAAGEDVSKRPAFDMKLEALIPVLKGEMPLKAHAHATEDIFAALRIAREFGVKITLEHVTEGHLIVEELAGENVPLAVGPSLTSASKFELRNKSWTTPGLLAAAGCQVSIITDSPVIPQEYLPLCAGLAVQAGMDPFAALQAITINPARHAGIADRVGSLEVGKDADLVVTDGCPFELVASVKHVFIDGKRVESDCACRFA